MAAMNEPAANAPMIIGVVGAGTMGRGIAQWAAQAGHSVHLYDVQPGATQAAHKTIGADLAKLVARSRMSAETAEAVLQRIKPVSSLQDLAPCSLVVEAILEDLDAKISLFRAVEDIVTDDTILATNTSSLSVAALAAGCRRAERVAGLHFFNPVPLMKVVEIVTAPATDPTIITRLTALCERSGHRPVIAQDMPGFIVNHAGRAFGPEGLRILAEGTAEPQEIDMIMREAAGFRMGPFELFDLIGLDVSKRVMNSIYDQFLQEPRYRPVALVAQRVAAGLLGRKSGRGFYDYPQKAAEPTPAPSAAVSDAPRIWISDDEPDLASLLLQWLQSTGATIDQSDKPAPNSLILITPIGSDATTTTIALGLDPARTVAVDMLFPEGRRLTMMGTPALTPHNREAARAALAATGRAVSVIQDSPGFVAQRIVAQIVSIGCEIAQQRIASPGDVDLAVRLGLGYPMGPLEWGDALGPRRILSILEALQTFYGDPCYRPSAWLKRRAVLGLSLRHLT